MADIRLRGEEESHSGSSGTTVTHTTSFNVSAGDTILMHIYTRNSATIGITSVTVTNETPVLVEGPHRVTTGTIANMCHWIYVVHDVTTGGETKACTANFDTGARCVMAVQVIYDFNGGTLETDDSGTNSGTSGTANLDLTVSDADGAAFGLVSCNSPNPTPGTGYTEWNPYNTSWYDSIMYALDHDTGSGTVTVDTGTSHTSWRMTGIAVKEAGGAAGPGAGESAMRMTRGVQRAITRGIT